MTNATVIRTTRAVYADPYVTHNFFVGPGTRCFVNPVAYKVGASGNLISRFEFNPNTSEGPRTVEVILEDGRKVTLDYLLPESQTSNFRTLALDQPQVG